MNSSLKKEISHYFEKKELSIRQIDALNEIQNRCKKQRRRGFQASPPLLWAASLAAILLFSITWSITWTWKNEKDISSQIVQEIALNHNKSMPVEIESRSIEEIQTYLAKLDFKLIRPERLSGENWELMGARYCSIQGNLAAQFRYKNTKTGQFYTLYQVPVQVQLKEEWKTPLKQYFNGAEVEIWTEKGLLIGLAK